MILKNKQGKLHTPQKPSSLCVKMFPRVLRTDNVQVCVGDQEFKVQHNIHQWVHNTMWEAHIAGRSSRCSVECNTLLCPQTSKFTHRPCWQVMWNIEACCGLSLYLTFMKQSGSLHLSSSPPKPHSDQMLVLIKAYSDFKISSFLHEKHISHCIWL